MDAIDVKIREVLEQQVSTLALVTTTRAARFLVEKEGWDPHAVLITRAPFNIAEIVRLGASLRRLALIGGSIGDEGARAVASLSKLTSLDLRNNEIYVEGARALASLSALTALHLDNNNIGVEGARSVASLSKLTSLYLDNNNIGVEGARAVASLSALTSLHLKYNDIGVEGARAVASLSKLTSLDLGSNNIGVEGARAVASLSALTSLDLMNNNIGDEGVRALASLSKLTSLYLANNNIGDEGARALASLSKLTSLDLADNDVGVEGARAVASLSKLTFLNLGDNNIGDEGARAVASLSALTSLYLDGNNIGDEGARVVSSLSKLTSLYLYDNNIGVEGARAMTSLSKLTSLDLGGNDIGDEGARAVASLSKLTSLYLANNNIGVEGARAVASLSALTSLYLWNNNIGDEGTRAVTSLSRLTSLDLMNNSIGDEGARAVASLSKLTSLDLSGNNIGDEGARALMPMTGLQRLSLARNKITILPEALLRHGDAAAIFAAYRRYQSSTVEPLNEVKLLVVGNEAVGKTSLIRYLTKGKPRNVDEPKTPGITMHERIETCAWTPGGHAGGLRLNVWDFGGQEILHETHKYFLTERSIYLLVLEDRREDDKSVYTWLRTIANRAGESPILIVINKCDDERPKLLLDETDIQRRWPRVLGILRTSCNADERAAGTIVQLKARIAEIVMDDPHLGHVRDPIPTPWRRVKTAVQELAGRQQVLEHQEFVRLCERDAGAERIDDASEQRALLGLLNDLGVVIAHGLVAEAPAALREVRLLDPNWLTGAIYTVITAGLVVQQNGMLRRDQLATLLAPAAYPPSRWEFILSMMRSSGMGLCFPLPGLDVETYLIPEALPMSTPELGWSREHLYLRFEYEFLPSGLIPRLIVEAHQKVSETRWRSGAVFTAAGCKVLVRGDIDGGRIDLYVDGPANLRRSALNVILEDLQRVHRLNVEAKPVALVPLPDDPEKSVRYDDLLWLEQKNGPDALHVPPGARREYRVGDLLDCVGRDLNYGGRPVVAATRRRGCDVLIMTALPEELEALRTVAGSGWTDGDEIHTYDLAGEHGTVRVVAASAVRMGGVKLTDAAAALVERLRPGCVAMCGVCAGHPDDTDLGDVVLADRVFHHDEGKRKEGGFSGDLTMHTHGDSWQRASLAMAGSGVKLNGYAEASEEEGAWWFLGKLWRGHNPLRSTALRRYVPDSRRKSMLTGLQARGLVTLAGRCLSTTLRHGSE